MTLVMRALGQADDFVNPCGGTRWRTLSDGQIELEDGSIPEFAPGTEQFRYLQQTWQNWAPQFRAAAKSFGVPVSWLVAAATQETGLWSNDPERQRTISSQDGFSSIGIMQPIPGTARMLGYEPDDRYDPQLNIDMGAKLMAQTTQRVTGGFPTIAASYNSGAPETRAVCKVGNDMFNLRGHQGKYVGNVIRYNNAAIAHLGVNDAPRILAAMGAGLALAGVAVALWLVYRQPRGISLPS